MDNQGCPAINEFYECKSAVRYAKRALGKQDLTDEQRRYWHRRLKSSEVALNDARSELRAMFGTIAEKKRKRGLPYESVETQMSRFQ